LTGRCVSAEICSSETVSRAAQIANNNSSTPSDVDPRILESANTGGKENPRPPSDSVTQ
jgi:hypothetical protein